MPAKNTIREAYLAARSGDDAPQFFVRSEEGGLFSYYTHEDGHVERQPFEVPFEVLKF